MGEATCFSTAYEVNIRTNVPVACDRFWFLRLAAQFLSSWRGKQWLALANALLNVSLFTHQLAIFNQGAYRYGANAVSYIVLMLATGTLTMLASGWSLCFDSRRACTDKYARFDRCYRTTTATKLLMFFAKILLVRTQFEQDVTLYLVYQ